MIKRGDLVLKEGFFRFTKMYTIAAENIKVYAPDTTQGVTVEFEKMN